MRTPRNRCRNLAVWDDYETDYTIFNVCGHDIRVYDDELAEALKQLSERNRETLLMYYFLEMNNEEIAKKQNISEAVYSKIDITHWHL